MMEGDELDEAIWDEVEDCRIIMAKDEAIEFLKSVEWEVIALDFETTSLSPLAGEVRLSCFYSTNTGAVIIDHFSAGSLRSLIKYYKPLTMLVYNAKFECRWLDYAAMDHKCEVWDVDFMAKAKLGGGHSSLAFMAKRDLKITLDKDLQTSDWSQPTLTDGQYQYAAKDAVVTWLLAQHWKEELEDHHWDGFHVMNDAVRGTIECEDVGLDLDIAVHEENVQRWEMKQANSLRCFRRYTPSSVIKNPNSKKQVSDFIKSQLDDASLAAWPRTDAKKSDQLKLDRKTIGPLAAKSPYPFSRWLNSYMLYNYYAKYTSTYGETLINKQMLGECITYRLNIAAAATGRYSSSSINIQNIPRKPYVRAAFFAPLWRGTMVLADYSGIEIRVLAELSGDENLLYDAIYGDVHSTSAAIINGIDEEKFKAVLKDKKHPLYLVYKELRSVAKGFTFQLTYGAGPEALSIVLKTDIAGAIDAVRAWAQKYPKAYAYRDHMFDLMSNTGFLPVIDGRSIYVRKPDRTMPVAANYPIQGAAASVMLRAVHHTFELRNKVLDYEKAQMAASVHDELLMYSQEKYAQVCHDKVLIPAMEQGWLDVFPNTSVDNLIESAIGPTWAEKP